MHIEMKKICLLALFAALTIGVNAQNQGEEPYDFYIDVALTWEGKDFYATVAFTNDKKEYICDENGDKMKFKNSSNVINYFTKLKWSFVQYVQHDIVSGKSAFAHIFLKKTVKTEEEAKQGINLEGDFKKK